MTNDRIIVLKFGGSSLKNSDCIKKVLDIITNRVKSGYKTVVVVSAQGKTTEALLKEAAEFAPNGNPREVDMLLTTGERASAAIVAMALESKGIHAISLTGSQAGIITDDNHTNARIIEIRPSRVLNSLSEGKTVIVSGFQGVSFKKEITTLGRGGSDTTAVALAAALNAEKCEIFSDIDGVYNADPAIIPYAEKLDFISYPEMQELSEAGAKVLHSRAVEFAKAHNIAIHCKSTFEPENPGTVIQGFENHGKIRKTAVAYEKNVMLFHTYEPESENLSTIANVLAFCAGKNIAVKQISFHCGYKNSMTGSFIISKKENYSLDPFISEIKEKFSHAVEIFDGLSAVSIIGEGITDTPEILLKLTALFRKNDIRIAGFHTSSFRISLLVSTEIFEKALNLLHEFSKDNN